MEEDKNQKGQSEDKKSLRRKLLYASFILDFFIVLGLIYYFAIFPREKIESLQESYIKVTVGKDQKAQYEIVKKRPKNWVRMKDINYTAAHAIVVSEDWSFYGHSGYDVGQIKEAVEEAVEGDRTRGASTISQQLIKNLFLTPEKSLVRKGKELLYSTYMERNVSKEKILEAYLNIAEFAPGVYGIKAASQHYFNKKPKDLTPKEGAFLAMLLPSPKRHSESFRNKEMTEFAEKTVNSILEKMVTAKYLREDQLEKAKEQSFSWEGSKATKKTSGSATSGSSGPQLEKAEGTQKGSTRTSSQRRQKKARKKKDLSGKSVEASYGVDQELKLDENPEFDEDAIVEDLDGMEAEFQVE